MALGWWLAAWGSLGCVLARPVVEASGCWTWSPWCEEVMETTERVTMQPPNPTTVLLPVPGMLQDDSQDSRGFIATNRGGDRKVDASNNVSFIHFGSAALSIGTMLLMVGLCVLVGYCAVRCRGHCLDAVVEATSGGNRGQMHQPGNQQVQFSNQPAGQIPVLQSQPAIMAPTAAFLLKAFDKMGGGRVSARFDERRRGNRGDRDHFESLRRSARYDNDVE